MTRTLVPRLVLPVLLAAGPAAAQDPGISSSIEKVFVVEMSHTDVGFTDPPTVVAQVAHDNLVEALRLADLDADFRWTVETGFQLEQFDRLATPADRARMRQRFAEGRFVLGAGYVGPHSGIWTEELLLRFTHPSARLAAEYGARMDAALLDDVPGYTLGMPTALARAGVDYLLCGPNDFIGGKPAIPLAERPFWWEGPDGSRVLTWETYGSYVEGFDEWGLLTLNSAYTKLGARLAEFEAAGYPYDAVMVMRGFDNTGPSLGLADLARRWNARYDNPEIILATPADFFEHLRAKYGDGFPVHRGDAGGHWEEGSQLTPASQAVVRRGLAQLPALEALNVLHSAGGAAGHPGATLERAWRACMLFLEHSGGGAGWPGLMTLAEVDQQNREFVALAKTVERSAAALGARVDGGLAPGLVPAGETGLVVLNPLGTAFDDLVEVDCGAPQPPDLALVDPATGTPLVFRWTSPDRSSLAFHAAVPANGWRRWRVESGGNAPPPPGWKLGAVVEIGGHRLEFDPLSGVALHLTDATGAEWIDGSQHRFGGIEHAFNLPMFFGIGRPLALQGVTVLVEDPGPVQRRARVIGPLGLPLAEYRLDARGRRLDFVAGVPLDRLPWVDPADHSEHWAVTFPFALSTPTSLLVDGPGGLYRPGPDSLPGAALGNFSVATGAVLTGAGGRWASLVPRESPILHLGAMTGAPSATVDDQATTLTTKLAQHIDTTEVIGGAIVPFQDEPGMPRTVVEHSVLRFGEAAEPAPGRARLAHDLAPPRAVWVGSGAAAVPPPAEDHFLELSGDVRAVALKRSADGAGLVLRLRAGSAASGEAGLRMPAPPREAWSADLLERREQPLPIQNGEVRIPLLPDAVITLLMTL